MNECRELTVRLVRADGQAAFLERLESDNALRTVRSDRGGYAHKQRRRPVVRYLLFAGCVAVAIFAGTKGFDTPRNAQDSVTLTSGAAVEDAAVAPAIWPPDRLLTRQDELRHCLKYGGYARVGNGKIEIAVPYEDRYITTLHDLMAYHVRIESAPITDEIARRHEERFNADRIFDAKTGRYVFKNQLNGERIETLGALRRYEEELDSVRPRRAR